MLDTIYLVTQIYLKLHFLRDNKDGEHVEDSILFSSMTRRALMLIHSPVIQILYSNMGVSVCSALVVLSGIRICIIVYLF